jgi:hypothetical protein
MMRLRCGKLAGSGGVPGAYSLTSRPGGDAVGQRPVAGG